MRRLRIAVLTQMNPGTSFDRVGDSGSTPCFAETLRQVPTEVNAQ